MSDMIKSKEGSLLLYHGDSDDVHIQVLFVDETVWMPQKRMAELFGVDVRTINEHLRNIYISGELREDATIRNFRIVQQEGNRQVARDMQLYNLDSIISVGYRVNSKQATSFRIWATKTLREFITKGFVLDDERLKNGQHFGKDYFDELLERIREIRASERRAYQKIADVFEQCSADYDPSSDATKRFYAFVQNKMHYAVTGQTAAEIVYDRADSEKVHMGLTTWRNAPEGKILKGDVIIAKNYLDEHEISHLNRLVVAFIDFAELRALNQQITTMQNWLERTDTFLEFADRPILPDAGKISHQQARDKAYAEYEKFRIRQDRAYISNFDRLLQSLPDGKE